MAISFLWALYLTASLILFATLHKSDGSLDANGANVCSRSQRYSIKRYIIFVSCAEEDEVHDQLAVFLFAF